MPAGPLFGLRLATVAVFRNLMLRMGRFSEALEFNALEREHLRRESELYQRQLRESLEQLAQNSSMLEAIFDNPNEVKLVIES